MLPKALHIIQKHGESLGPHKTVGVEPSAITHEIRSVPAVLQFSRYIGVERHCTRIYKRF